MLDLEREWWQFEGPKDALIRRHVGVSASRYYRLLQALLEAPEAMAYDPILVKRLIRLRTYRQRQRVARLLGAQYSPGQK